VVLDGGSMLRTPDGERELRAGDTPPLSRRPWRRPPLTDRSDRSRRRTSDSICRPRADASSLATERASEATGPPARCSSSRRLFGRAGVCANGNGNGNRRIAMAHVSTGQPRPRSNGARSPEVPQRAAETGSRSPAGSPFWLCDRDPGLTSGGGGIRTLGRPKGRQRFSRPPRSTAPAPLREPQS
jgi:hypothetical protein